MMSLADDLLNFPRQFDYHPEIINARRLRPADKFMVAGLGGSHLAAGLLKTAHPRLDLLIHQDYGLPRVPEYFLKTGLLIISSYSGNTEEVIDCFRHGLEQNLNLSVITTGGRLLEMAQANEVPYVQIPDLGLAPRFALGLSLLAILRIIGAESDLSILRRLGGQLDLERCRARGQELAREFSGFIPIIYASTINLSLAYIWKIKLNETAKIPAFYNVFPELNHNEIEGLASHSELSSRFRFLFLSDHTDHPRLQKRMTVLEHLLFSRSLKVISEPLTGASVWLKLFSSLLIADWASLALAEQSGLDPKSVPLIEDFKSKLNQ